MHSSSCAHGSHNSSHHHRTQSDYLQPAWWRRSSHSDRAVRVPQRVRV